MVARLAACIVLSVVSAPLLRAQGNDQYLVQWARRILAESADEKDPEARRDTAVAFSLGTSQDSSTSTLKSLMADKDYAARESAVTSFGELGDPKFIPVIKPALEDDVPEVMFAAARALFQLGDPSGQETLLAVFEGETKAESSFLRGKFRDMARRLKTPKSALLFAAEQGVGLVPVFGAGAGYSALSELLSDSSFSPRAASLLMLSSRRSEEIDKLIQGAFTDEDWSVRATAIQIAAKWNLQGWSSRLIPLFQDGNRKVRLRAAALYIRFARQENPAQGGKTP
jgi:HEAT repeat protein